MQIVELFKRYYQTLVKSPFRLLLLSFFVMFFSLEVALIQSSVVQGYYVLLLLGVNAVGLIAGLAAVSIMNTLLCLVGLFLFYHQPRLGWNLGWMASFWISSFAFQSYYLLSRERVAKESAELKENREKATLWHDRFNTLNLQKMKGDEALLHLEEAIEGLRGEHAKELDLLRSLICENQLEVKKYYEKSRLLEDQNRALVVQLADSMDQTTEARPEPVAVHEASPSTSKAVYDARKQAIQVGVINAHYRKKIGDLKRGMQHQPYRPIATSKPAKELNELDKEVSKVIKT
ncbi:MAG: hypothetical protein S4CHLAM102_15180 [Chlamydiia bacterium]|nr:hypothetical protein [Chlamydiia bacterium]